MIRCIGIGLPRTGNASLAAALEQLGLRTAQYTPALARCQTYADGRAALAALDCEAAVDYPCCMMAGRLAGADLPADFPEARFVLTVRSSLMDWYASLCRHVGRILATGDLDRIAEIHAVHDAIFGTILPDFGEACRGYEIHMAVVRESIPGDRLLVLNAEAGGDTNWRALCAHLGLPAPMPAWPHLNRSAATA